jgi:hypothetical protein
MSNCWRFRKGGSYERRITLASRSTVAGCHSSLSIPCNPLGTDGNTLIGTGEIMNPHSWLVILSGLFFVLGVVMGGWTRIHLIY